MQNQAKHFTGSSDQENNMQVVDSTFANVNDGDAL